MMTMETNTCMQKNTPSSLSMHKKSHIIISKPKPKIRIIHIFAPEIIKTDVENFRELVQRLTGKPMDHDKEVGSNKIKKSPDTVSRNKREPRKLGCPSSGSMKKMEMAVMRAGLQFRERLRGEDEIWKFANSGGGFLSGFGDHHHQFDGLFMQEICDGDDQFPLMMECTTAAAVGTTHQVVDVFGEA